MVDFTEMCCSPAHTPTHLPAWFSCTPAFSDSCLSTVGSVLRLPTDPLALPALLSRTVLSLSLPTLQEGTVGGSELVMATRGGVDLGRELAVSGRVA